MKRIALFPGSFDPFTIGHEEIVRRALPLFDNIIVAIGYNSAKQGYFSLEKRINWIKDIFKDENKIIVDAYEGLTADYCVVKNAKFILRGLRTAADFEYERAIAQMNKMLKHDIETVFLLTKPEHSPISSTIVREIIRYGGDASQFVPKEIDLLK
ncbi:MAG: pantetheine-phosphate adenylyltransferase [Bacteroidales bacterium]|nr:pantetheine-phosphate adenylyltransferase [Bacteroidales bacterium]MBN2757260.1 pantetheine-phosphate adenylyltransferase [Bacteroidales bacterium]